MSKRIYPSSILTVCALGFVAPHGFAQTAPDAGALQQQIDREHQQNLPKRIAPEKPAAPAAMKPAAGVSVTVRQFRFSGNTLLTAEQLAPAVADFLNRPLDFSQLNAAAAAVAEVYRAAGWVVRAYLPQQDIKDGTVVIQIVEAVFGKLRFEGNEPARLKLPQAIAVFSAQQEPGAPLNADALDRALLIADDLPGVAVAGSLVAGASERETDLVLKLADEPLIVGEAAIDNTGSRSTGSDRLTANISLNSPFGIGDLLTANAIHTQGSDYLRLSYTLPVGSNGWRVGANTSHLAYELVAPEFKALNGKGTSDSAGLEASYPILRSRLANLFLNLSVDHKKFDNESGGSTTTRYSINDVSIALNGNLFDNWGGGGANSGSLTLVSGSRDNQAGTTNQRFDKLRYGLSRQQAITNDFSFFAQGSGQESSDKLDSAEKFYLGGAGGVRAYPSSEGGGDSGVLTNLELRWKLPEGFTLTGFHDYGHVRNNDAAMSYSLKGVGLSLGWQAPVGVNFKATWAHRLGNNPNPTAAGNDQDGSLDRNRLWLSAILPF
jgi:hemolysin activation/secretion protein